MRRWILLSVSGVCLPVLAVFALSPSVASGDILGGESLKQNLDLPFDAAGAEGEEDDPPEILVFYGGSYEASAVCFALDESGSMRDQGRWQLQTREVVRAISELSSEAEFGVVYYGSRVSAFRNAPVRADPGNKDAGVKFITSRSPAGDTCVGEGTVKAIEIVRKSDSKYRAVIVTSDGRPDNCATGNRATPAEVQMIYNMTLQANSDRSVRVHSIYVGRSNDRDATDFMRRLAEIHGGTFRVVNS